MRKTVEEYLTVREAARRLSVSAWYVRALLKQGALDYWDTGKGYRISALSINEFIGRRRIVPSQN